MRNNFIGVRLSDEEMEQVDGYRDGTKLSRSGFLRETALGNPPRIIPAINREQWVELSRLASNLNQLAREANKGNFSPDAESAISSAVELLSAIRCELVGC